MVWDRAHERQPGGEIDREPVELLGPEPDRDRELRPFGEAGQGGASIDLENERIAIARPAHVDQLVDAAGQFTVSRGVAQVQVTAVPGAGQPDREADSPLEQPSLAGQGEDPGQEAFEDETALKLRQRHTPGPGGGLEPIGQRPAECPRVAVPACGHRPVATRSVLIACHAAGLSSSGCRSISTAIASRSCLAAAAAARSTVLTGTPTASRSECTKVFPSG